MKSKKQSGGQTAAREAPETQESQEIQGSREEMEPADFNELPEDASDKKVVGGENKDTPDREAASDEAGSLRQTIAEMSVELEEARGRILRMQADFENARKRMERDTERSLKFAVESFARQLLETKDNLERALLTVDGSDDIGAGLILTLKNLKTVFDDHRIEEIAPIGEAFNPELHEAVGMQNSGEYDPNTVMTVVQKGYKLHERLLRPARVIIAAADVNETEDAANGGEAEQNNTSGHPE